MGENSDVEGDDNVYYLEEGNKSNGGFSLFFN